MRAVRVSTSAAMVVVLAGCTPDIAEQNESPVILRVTSVEGLQGGGGAGAGIGSVLLSDVQTDEGAVFNDNATITVENLSKNRNLPDPGPFNDVMLEQYRVRYFRTDGLDREGVDVPFSFSGPLGALVPANGTAGVSLVIVRHAAKLEPPLANLRGFGGFDLITTIAEITLIGRTTAGKAVQATARLEVHFSDFGG